MSGRGVAGRARAGASERQLRAVYSVMRILAEEDRGRIAPDDHIGCAACRRARPAAGSVDYGGVRLCNGCATDYELLRMAAVVEDLRGYLGRGTIAMAAE